MTEQQRKNIKDDIKRSIVHISRINNVYEEAVESILIDDYVDEDDFILIQWPEVQDLMEKDGFCDNACLADGDIFVRKYGSSAFFVNKKWLNSLE